MFMLLCLPIPAPEISTNMRTSLTASRASGAYILRFIENFNSLIFVKSYYRGSKHPKNGVCCCLCLPSPAPDISTNMRTSLTASRGSGEYILRFIENFNSPIFVKSYYRGTKHPKNGVCCCLCLPRPAPDISNYTGTSLTASRHPVEYMWRF